MKKTLILASVLALTMSSVWATEFTKTTATVETTTKQEAPQKPANVSEKPKRPESEFEKRLKLTDEQKQKAKELRRNSHKEIKPIMEQMKLKHEEIEAVKLTKLAPQAQEEKIQSLKAEMMELHKKAHEIRMNNMKEFEALLTKTQLKELKKIKDEGRKRYEKEHGKRPHHPEFGPGFGPRPPHKPGEVQLTSPVEKTTKEVK